VPVTAWRIGFTRVTCDRCGRVEESLERPDGYTALLRAGWIEVAPGRGAKILGRVLGRRPVGTVGQPMLPDLHCPACADATRPGVT
jgi:hypothetical protein